jgi:hypothetical protein
MKTKETKFIIKKKEKKKNCEESFIVNEENYEYINYEKRLHSVGTACTLMHKMPNKR